MGNFHVVFALKFNESIATRFVSFLVRYNVYMRDGPKFLEAFAKFFNCAFIG